MGQTLGSKVRQGYLWTLFGGGMSQVFSFLVSIVLARLITPAEFGIIAACLLFTDVAASVVSAGFVSALIQKRDASAVDLSAGFVLQLVSGTGIALALMGGAPFIAWFMGEPRIGPVLMVLSVNAVLLAFISTPQVIARRALNFRLVTMVQGVQLGTYGLVALAMAWAGCGVWSLVGGRIAGNVVQALYLSLATGWRPTLRFSAAAARTFWKMAAQFSGKNILGDLTANIDYFITGWRLGIEPLGFYSRAYYLMTVPIGRLSGSVGTVLFPAFSHIQDEPDRVNRGLLKANCLMAMTIFPMLIGLEVVADLLIPVIYGARWMPSVAPLTVLCVAGLFHFLESPGMSLLNAKGYLKETIYIHIANQPVLWMGVFIGTFWGITGVAWGVAFAAFTHWALLVALLRRRIGFSIAPYLKALVPGAVAAASMALAVVMFRTGMSQYGRGSGLVGLVSAVVLGAAVYPGVLWGLHCLWKYPVFNDAFEEVFSLLQSLWSHTWTFFTAKQTRPAV